MISPEAQDLEPKTWRPDQIYDLGNTVKYADETYVVTSAVMASRNAVPAATPDYYRKYDPSK